MTQAWAVTKRARYVRGRSQLARACRQGAVYMQHAHASTFLIGGGAVNEQRLLDCEHFASIDSALPIVVAQKAVDGHTFAGQRAIIAMVIEHIRDNALPKCNPLIAVKLVVTDRTKPVCNEQFRAL